jgi:hypothetical protein
MFATALVVGCVLAGDPAEWVSYGSKPQGKPAVTAPATPGVSEAAKKQYAEAGAKLQDGEYGHANDLLNALAQSYPRWPEVFASRCSAQIGLQHWDAAVADCNYALTLKPTLVSALYGLAVAEDGQGRLAEAVKHYRDYAGLGDAQAALKTQASQRADLLAARMPAGGAVAPPPPAPGAKGTFRPGIPSPGRLLLYVYRNILFGMGTGVTVLVDNQPAGELPNDTYLELEILPGKRTVTLKAAVSNPRNHEPTASWVMDTQEGDVAYLKLEYAPQGDDVAFRPVPVTGEVGRREIREDCSLISSRKL